MKDMCFCSQCHQWARRWATITVNNVPYHYCEACWQKQRELFARNLETDARARKILKMVTDAALKARKKGHLS